MMRLLIAMASTESMLVAIAIADQITTQSSTSAASDLAGESNDNSSTAARMRSRSTSPMTASNVSNLAVRRDSESGVDSWLGFHGSPTAYRIPRQLIIAGAPAPIPAITHSSRRD